MPPREAPTHQPDVQCRKRKRSDSAREAGEPSHKRSRNSQETHLWTTVKKYLKDPCQNPAPRVSCPICSIPIAIRGVPILKPCPWKIADGSQKIGVVLPCTHVICQQCMNSHISAQAELSVSGQRTCPYCRADLLFPGCKHLIPIQRLPVATSEDASMVPLTKPEMLLDQHFPEECYDCTAACAKNYVDVSMLFVSELINNSAACVPGQAENPEWQNVVEASQRLVRDYLARQYIGPNWIKENTSSKLLEVSFADQGLANLVQGFQPLGHDAIVYSGKDENSTESQAFWFVPVHRSHGSS